MVDPDETPEDRAKHERFQCWKRGWLHGVRRASKDKRFTDHPRREIWEAYLRGYANGEDAVTIACFNEAERLDYNPRMSILRSEPPTEAPRHGTGEP